MATAGPARICFALILVSCGGTTRGGGATSSPVDPAREHGPEAPPPDVLEGVTAIRAADRHTCALLEGGGVACWGDGAGHALGDGSERSRGRPVRVPGIEGAVELEASGRLTCARLGGGEVRCWGRGVPGIDGSPTPTAVAALRGATDLAIAGDQVCWLDADREPRCLGRRPMDLSGLGPAAEITLTDFVVCLRRRDGEVRCATRVQVERRGPDAPPGELLADDAVALTQACARRRSGRIRCFPEESDYAPKPELEGVVELSRYEAVFSGDDFQCTLLEDGSVWCWQAYGAGALGTADREERGPARVPGIDDAVAVSSGETHTCALHRTGRVSCWGRGPDGQLGHDPLGGSGEPVEVGGLPPARRVWAGHSHGCALSREGALFCWGDNAFGQLGRATATDVPPPIAVEGLGDVRDVAIGADHTCVLHGGSVTCFGLNRAGQLGAATEGDRGRVDVEGLEGIVGIAAADGTTYAWTAEGELHRWGVHEGREERTFGASGEMGLPVSIDITCARRGGGDSCRHRWGTDRTPFREAFPAVDVVVGSNFACGLGPGGGLRCWGHTPLSRDGTVTNVSAAADVLEACIGGPVCVRLEGGEVACFEGASPEPVQGIAGAEQLFCGAALSCARLEDGTARCWRRVERLPGRRGETVTPLPAQLPFAGAVDVAAGTHHACAAHESGAVVCLGDNARGQLGVGRASAPYAPVTVVRPR